MRLAGKRLTTGWTRMCGKGARTPVSPNVGLQKQERMEVRMRLVTILAVGLLIAAAPAIAQMPADVLAQIKAKAALDFPDDYSTQKYVIGTQKQAYAQVKNYRDTKIPPVILSKLKQKASADFPLDFSTQKYVLDTQVAAYVVIQTYSAQGVPADVLKRIKQKAAREFPNDYSTQKYVINTQVSAYKSMQ